MVRRHLGRRFHPTRLRLRERLDRLPRGEVEQVQRLPLVRGERQVALDHQALGHRGIAGEAELGRNPALVHLTAPRERRLLAVQRQAAAGDGAVLERAPHQARRDHRLPVVGERGGARGGKLGHLGQLGPALVPRNRREEADRHLGLCLRRLRERAEHYRRVDDGLGIRHRQDRAVTAGCGRGRAGSDRLLVLTAGRAQVDVRVDERGREHEALPVDDPVRLLEPARVW